MTISSEIFRSGPYAGNGVTRAFDYKFKVISADHLRVARSNAAGVETVMVRDRDYTVTGVGNEGGGQAILTAPLPAGEKVTLLINVPFTQETDLENQGPYQAEVVEAALDMMVMRLLQLKEQASRALTVPAYAAGADLEKLTGDIRLLGDRIANLDAIAANIHNLQSVAAIAGTLGTAPALVSQAIEKATAAAASAAAAAVSADRAATWDPASYAKLSGAGYTGWVASTVGFGLIGPFGTNEFAPGNGDAATFATHNMALRGWYGLGMVDRTTGVAKGVYNFRDGTWNVKGGYFVDGAQVWHAGNLTPFDANSLNEGRRLAIYNKNDGYSAILSNNGAPWGKLLRVETQGDGTQGGPQINFHKLNSANWGVGIKHFGGPDGGNFAWYANSHEAAEGTLAMMLAPQGDIWTATYGWLSDYVASRAASRELEGVGAYGVFIGDPGPGTLVAGSSLTRMNGAANFAGSPPGTWRCMATIPTGAGYVYGLFVRIA